MVNRSDRRSAMRWLGALALSMGASRLHAQASGEPLKIVIPFGAGGTSDLLARMLAPLLSERLQRPVIVENKPGVNGVVGMNAVATATADGSTVVFTDMVTMTVTPWVISKLGYKPFEDFAPVAMAAYFPYVFAINPALPIHDIAELKAYASERAGRFNLATGGTGTQQHLVGLEIAGKLGCSFTYVAYKSSPASLLDLIGGSVDGIVLSSPPLLPHLRSGKLRAIAVSGAKRWDLLPQVPTFDEQGLAGYSPGGWQGVLAPRKTSKAAIDRLAFAFNQSLAQPEVRKMLGELGAELRMLEPPEMLALLQQDSAKWRSMVKAQQIVAE